ncbi:MAG TPA: phospholipase [Bauldia sp.]|nr:phospholipase [Bauldia sp.]
MSAEDPHRGQRVLTAGAPLAEAKGAVLMFHGRGADAADIIGLARVINRPGLAYLAPDAAEHAWYPRPFMSPQASNEPWLSSAKGVVAHLIAEVGLAGIALERTVLIGFSQGACLATEFAARNPRRYGAVIALSGGLIGDRVDAGDYAGSLAGTPVFVGCSDADPFIPLARVQESAAIMAHLGGEVTERIYPHIPHTIVPDEIEHVRAILDAMVGAASS